MFLGKETQKGEHVCGKTEYHFGYVKFKEVMDHPMGGGQRKLGKMKRTGQTFVGLGCAIRHHSCVNYC